MVNGYESPKRAWVTLLTAPSYLPGVITLAYGLSLQKTVYPLIVLVTRSLPPYCMRALELERSQNSNILIQNIEPLLPPHYQKMTLIASRFQDTWTKLRAFELTSYDKCAFIDADIVVYRNMDHIFDIQLPNDDWIAANGVCVCNLDHDKWAASDWTPENCPYTPLSHPSSADKATPVPSKATPPNPYSLLNGGLFLYHPSESLWQDMLNYFNTSSALSSYQFPDQDFLADFFCHRWKPLPWKYNALKTMQNWHTNIWRDEEVYGLHYIVDKPWSKRVASDGIAGYLGRDGKTHTWWWDLWDQWRKSRGASEVGQVLDTLVAPPLDAQADRKQCQENRDKGFPKPIVFGKRPVSVDSDKENKEPESRMNCVRA